MKVTPYVILATICNINVPTRIRTVRCFLRIFVENEYDLLQSFCCLIKHYRSINIAGMVMLIQEIFGEALIENREAFLEIIPQSTDSFL
jgi:hypothetical protein